ncbi:hypothetical protein BAE44_0013421 [Dichanthelium oligosanthes]|uniref:DUF3475 domain-containing protein n=1 Tax=Dichanthelium oligosanthes TaxID=888268 RepID=A0A1E5VKB2_9POAL|nr:hypothetical protein BAE44_0013421 [Dichanthelium oligosanthes]
MDWNSCYVLKSRRRFVGIADASFEDAADGISEFGDRMSATHKQEVKGAEGTMETVEKQELAWNSNLLSLKDDDFLLPGSSKLYAPTSGETAVSGKMGLSELRLDRSGSVGTSKASGGYNFNGFCISHKTPRLGSGLGTASMAGFGKAVELLDTLGSLVTTFSPDGGFISRSKTKGCKISILAFEVANTILKGGSIMQSLSEDTVKYFKQVVLPSEGVQSLVSSDMSELMQIAANDKREELKIFAQEVVRFGNRCKDAQWHNLDRYFVKLESEGASQKQLKETAISEMQKLMTLVQRTTDLYHELHALDRFEQEYRSKLKGKDTERFEKGIKPIYDIIFLSRKKMQSLCPFCCVSIFRTDRDYRLKKGIVEAKEKKISLIINLSFIRDSIQILRLELKTQRSYVKSLKKRSLWSKTLEEVVEKLVEIVHYLHIEINCAFGPSGTSMAQCLLLNQSNLLPADPCNAFIDGFALSAESPVCCQRLGPAGLALHYANIVIQIYSIVSFFSLFLLTKLRF